MTAPQRSPTPDFAMAQRELMLQVEKELETTKRVLSAVRDRNRDSHLDPKSRTAGEWAWPQASRDVQLHDEIAKLKFEMAPRYKEEPRKVAELVQCYDTYDQRALAGVRAMRLGQLTTPVDFAGLFHLPAVFYPGFVNNPSIHPRRQLAAFLRPRGSRVPAMYGHSADEPWNS
jgi:hypothetical protein